MTLYGICEGWLDPWLPIVQIREKRTITELYFVDKWKIETRNYLKIKEVSWAIKWYLGLDLDVTQPPKISDGAWGNHIQNDGNENGETLCGAPNFE